MIKIILLVLLVITLTGCVVNPSYTINHSCMRIDCENMCGDNISCKDDCLIVPLNVRFSGDNEYIPEKCRSYLDKSTKMV